MAKVLIADDSEIMRKSLTVILTEAGHTVAAEAVNGLQACMEFEKSRPDLVIMDVDMPFFSGLDALRTIMKRNPMTNVVMLSSQSCSSVICETINAGAKALVIKPFYVQELMGAVNHALQYECDLKQASIDNIYRTIEGF
ncbi:MAG: response regulator receiver protein [Clostridia bacterium]|jgi:two-component system chemotaxis response regulator CheY|nr:response regulator receiver protein [Clostridia bacterium]